MHIMIQWIWILALIPVHPFLSCIVRDPVNIFLLSKAPWPLECRYVEVWTSHKMNVMIKGIRILSSFWPIDPFISGVIGNPINVLFLGKTSWPLQSGNIEIGPCHEMNIVVERIWIFARSWPVHPLIGRVIGDITHILLLSEILEAPR